VWLDEVVPEIATRLAGAKMGRLSELIRAGLKVPRGFSVTVDAYLRHCGDTGLDTLIDERLGKLTDANDEAQVQAAGAQIRAAFESTELSDKLVSAILDAYDELAYRVHEVHVPVAVRSSATGEDGDRASFAGIFDTYLGVSGHARVLRAVRGCWASLFNYRALAYRVERGVSHREMPMAVGIIELIAARASGVAFSIHPVSGKRDRVVIEGNWGWGEAVVQGRVTPDHVEVGKSDGRVIRYDVADKTVVSAFDYRAGEVVETEMPRRWRHQRVLDDDQIRAVTAAVVAVEREYGVPVDVEWVIDRGHRTGDPVFVVQARPETVHGAVDRSDPTPATTAEGGWDPATYAARHAFGG
jgi:pyruvate,water dikinase